MPVFTKAGEEGVVSAWMVDEGAPVKAGQLIAEVQVEKVAVEVLAPIDGVVIGLVPINQPVRQGQPICRIGDAAVRPGPETGRVPVPSNGPEADQTPVSSARPEMGRAAASPAARRLAAELGVDLAAVTGTGPGGRITEADITVAARGAGRGSELGGLRATIARNLRRSRNETAAFTITTTADVTGRVPRHISAWLLKQVAEVLPRYPHINGQRSGDRFTSADKANISLAIQTDAGLVAPVIGDVGSRSIGEIAATIEALAEKARSGRLEATDFEGGTFTVSNLGSFGIDAFTPIINLPQVAILGVGAIRTVPGFSEDGQVTPRQHLTLSLTVDHAFIDGAPAAAFLAEVRSVLEG